MRGNRCAGVGIVCVALGAAGCLWKTTPAEGDRRAHTVSRTAPPTEGISIDHVLLEQPVGDTFMNEELWANRPTPATPATTALLAENGLRVAIVSGNLPPKFQTLLASEPDTVNPRRFIFGNAKEHVIPTAGPTDPCRLEVLRDLAASRVKMQLSQARSGIMVRPEATTDRRIRLTCEPQIQHGERQEWLRPTADGTQFVKHGEVPTERFTEMAFDATLGVNDYLLIGWNAVEAGTLGATLFGVVADGRPRQRVLVIRAGQVGAVTSDLPAIASRRPSVAAEASKR
jgi:hypothetical protein